MDQSLLQLKNAMPPLKSTRSTNLSWNRLESRVGLTYPASYKEFVSVYGGSIWCGNWCPFYDDAKSDKKLHEFMQSIADFMGYMRGNMHDWDDLTDIDLPLYPEDGGLFPFLVDYNNSSFCWRTKYPDPNKWPVICWVDRRIAELRGITIAGMFLEWIQGKKRMTKVWGSVKDIEPEEF